jgi:predicted Zn-dependent protease
MASLFYRFFKGVTRQDWIFLGLLLSGLKKIFQGFLVSLILEQTLTAGMVPLRIPQGHLIRDSEIESVFKDYAHPILKHAHLNPYDFKIFLLADPNINAFATLGNLVCIHSGLIIHCQDGEEFLGVLAHEIGHITGRHILRFLSIRDNAFYQSLIPMIIGAIAAGLTKDLRGLVAGSTAGSSMYNEMTTGYTHVQESSADQFACKAITHCGWSLEGMKRFMKRMEVHESKQSYLRTHPFFKERIEVVDKHLETHKGKKLPPALAEGFFRLKTKIAAFTLPKERALMIIQGLPCSQSIKNYGRAIVAYREERSSQALAYLEKAFHGATQPEFLYALKASIFMENKNLPGAYEAIEHALKIRKKDIGFLILKAQIMLGDPQQKNFDALIQELEPLTRHPIHRFEDSLWYFLGIAHGRMKNTMLMRLCLAEHAFLTGNYERSGQQLSQVLKVIRPGHPFYHHAKILERQIQEALQRSR